MADIDPAVAECADVAMKAVTRWFTERIYDGTPETSLEFFVRNQVRKVQRRARKPK